MSAQNKKNTPQAPDKKKQIIIGVICLIVLLNITWTIMQNKFTPKLDSIKADFAGVEQRMNKLEHGGVPDVEEIKADFAKLQAVSDKFTERVEQLLKLEEDQLAALEAQTAAQRARVEALKKLLAPSAE